MEGHRKLTGRPRAPATAGVPQPDRFRAFLKFFKRYLGVWSVGAAALPLPVAKFHLIPVYDALRDIFATYVSLFCFLLAGYVFYSRHPIARWMFQSLRARTRWGRRAMALLPVVLILAAIACAVWYQIALTGSLQQVAYAFRKQGRPDDADSVLQSAAYDEIGAAIPLLISYLGIFMAAEAAFLLMAIREYMQDILRLSDAEVLRASS